MYYIMKNIGIEFGCYLKEIELLKFIWDDNLIISFRKWGINDYVSRDVIVRYIDNIRSLKLDRENVFG